MLFGERSNANGPDEVRLATAEYDSAQSQWQVDLLAEPETLTADNLPSRQLFKSVIAGIKQGQYSSDWVFYIHGFNQSFKDSLEASWRISQRYNVDVIVFSWASNPGGWGPSEYNRARQAARSSANALDHALQKMGSYLIDRPQAEIGQCNVRLNLLIHSLGNYLVENFVRDPIFSGETRIFDNVIFHQADVDHKHHDMWIDRVEYGRRIYVTINENDGALKVSDISNPSRLGSTALGTAATPVYVDFTNADNVDRDHDFCIGDHGNPAIYRFFQQVLTSHRGELASEFTYDSRTNTFIMQGGGVSALGGTWA
ncbi:alpha/beta hydrolase [Romeriopsis navalis]|nr:alpha/beta hydrolase [Romeriopsis navalis]